MIELLNFINTLITLYVYIIIAGAVMSWLIAFNVANPTPSSPLTTSRRKVQ
jgi:YggT family protein